MSAEEDYTAADRNAILARLIEAFQSLTNGSSDLNYFDTLSRAFNIGVVRCEKTGSTAKLEVFLAAIQGLLQAEMTYAALHCFTWNVASMTAVVRGIEGYHDLLVRSTPKQMEEAIEECKKRLEAGHHAALRLSH